MNKKMIRNFAIAAGIITGVAAFAQEPPMSPPGGQRGGQQGGPQGGFPGGPPPMGGMRQMRMAGPMLVLRPDVREELKITEDQAKKIREAFPMPPMGGRGQGGPGFGGPGAGGPPPQGGPGGQGFGGPGAGGPPPQGGPGGQGFGGRGQGGPGMGGPGMGQAGMRPEEAEKKLKSILDAKQYDRYREISLQLSGPEAVLRRDVAKELNLSSEQASQIQDILEENRPPMGGQGFGGPGAGGPPQGGRGFQGGPGRPGGQGGPGSQGFDGQGFGGPGAGGPPPQGGPGGEGFGGGPGRPGGQGGPGMPPRENEAQRKKVEAKILSVLTDDQKSKWKSMLGKKFESKEQPRPPQED